MDDGELHLHHIFYKWGKPDGDDNLITLCRHCHFHIHFNKEGLRTKETTWRQRMYELMDRFAKDGYLWEHQISSMV
jgi:predicted SprT family Zn-dependent metalloprotease